MGPCFRSLLAAELTGIQDLVARIRTCGRHSDYYIHGYGRRSTVLLKILVIGAVGSFVTEALMEDMLTDDRVVKRFHILQDICHIELMRVLDISEDFMSVCADMCESNKAELRSCISGAAITSVAFFTGRVFDAVRSYPWCLALGDKMANITRLRGAPLPNEVTANKVHALVNSGFSEAMLEEGLTFVENAPWSSRVVEQLHGSGAQVHKYHPEMGVNSFQCRAFMHALRTMVNPSQEDKDGAKLQARLQKLESTTFRRISGRHVYLKRCCERVQLQCGGDVKKAQALRKALFHEHSAMYQALSPEVRASYEELALSMGDRKLEAFWDELSMVRTDCLIQHERSREETEKKNPFSMGSSRWSGEDLERLQSFTCSGDFSASKVDALRGAAQRAPDLPDMDFRLKLSKFPLPRADAAVARPSWLGDVCWQREHFVGCGFRKRSADASIPASCFVFCHASQSPYRLSLAHLKTRPRPAAHVLQDGLPAAGDEWWNYVFDIDWLRFANSDDDMSDWEEHLVDVFPILTHLRGGMVVTDQQPLPLVVFLAGLPEPRRARGAPAAAVAADPAAQTALVAANPWMLHHLD